MRSCRLTMWKKLVQRGEVRRGQRGRSLKEDRADLSLIHFDNAAQRIGFQRFFIGGALLSNSHDTLPARAAGSRKIIHGDERLFSDSGNVVNVNSSPSLQSGEAPYSV